MTLLKQSRRSGLLAPRVVVAVSFLPALLACGRPDPRDSQDDSSSEVLGAKATASKPVAADGAPRGRASELGVITIELPSPAEVCAKRQETIDAIIEHKSKQILEFCNKNSRGNCAERDECFKGLLRQVDPGEIALTLSVSNSLQVGSIGRDTARSFLIETTTSVNESNRRQGLTVFFGFKWTFGESSKNRSAESCVPPMETFRGKLFVRTLLREVAAATQLDADDSCRLEAIESGTEIEFTR